MSITLIIIIITSGVSFLAWNNTRLFNMLIFNPYSVFHRNEWYRLFSSALLHADIPHLVINMYVLYSFGEVVETYYPIGKFMYLLMYFAAIAVANIKTLLENKNNSWYNAVGASGAVSAVVFAFVLFAPKQELGIFGIIPVPAVLYGLLFLFYSQYMSKKGTDNIGHDAHFFGAVFGFVFTGLLHPSLFKQFMDQLLNR